MLSVAGAGRLGAALLVVVTACGGLTGCGSGDKSATQSTPSSTKTPEAPGGFDISRIEQLANQFPPAAVADPPNVAGCDRVSFSVPDEVKGIAERIPAPPIAGIKTTGTKMHMALTTAEGQKTVEETTFRAELSARVEIAVGGKGDPARLTNLLDKAVDAVRGH